LLLFFIRKKLLTKIKYDTDDNSHETVFTTYMQWRHQKLSRRTAYTI